MLHLWYVVSASRSGGDLVSRASDLSCGSLCCCLLYLRPSGARFARNFYVKRHILTVHEKGGEGAGHA